jgi:flagellar capping protein FliD
MINPWQILGVIGLLIGSYFYGHHSGYQERVGEDQIEIARLNDEARTKEQQVTTKFNELNKQLSKAKDEIKQKQFSIDERIDSGKLRLPSNCPVHASTDPSSGDGSQTSESDRQTIKDIVSIATDGDSAIEDYNTCVRKYNEVRDKFNKVLK